MKTLGVLGGMGPLATVEFLRQIIQTTAVETDQENLPTVIYSVPQIPSRVEPILRGEGESPLGAMLVGIATLETAGAEYIAMPCITAHHWYNDLCKSTRLPFIHIADATGEVLKQIHIKNKTVGLLATAATIRSGFFQSRMEGFGYETLVPDEREMTNFLLPGISNVKRGRLVEACKLVSHSVEWFMRRKINTIILGCSELPLALTDAEPELKSNCLDSINALARACVAEGL